MTFCHFYHYFAMLNGVRYREIFGCLWVFGPIKRGVFGRKSGGGGMFAGGFFLQKVRFWGCKRVFGGYVGDFGVELGSVGG